MEAQSHFQHGCSLFVDEDYVGALSSFNKAIEADASNEEYFIKRSTCLFKLKKFTEALADANSALKINPNSPKAYFRKGMACFSLDEFETAKAAFEKGKNLDPQDTNFSLWLRKCNAELEENENEIGEAETQAEKEEPAKPTVVEQKPEALPPSAAMSIEEAQTLPIKEEEKKPAVRHSWYQNDNFVCITFFVRERTDKDVAIKIDTKTLDVDIKLPDGGSFIFDIDLCNDVIPSESKTVINKANIEVKLKKVKTLQWGTLEYTGAALPSISPATAENIKHVYPSSSRKKKNWDQLAAQVEEEKLEGEQALNKVFQDIYSNGSEEQRRAMLKSFVESGGTVLSTNWDDVKKAEVKGSPPKGMEVKKYNE